MLLLLFFIIQWYKRGAAYEPLTNRDTLMIHYKGYMAMYHYSKRIDYQSIARKAMLNNDTMILF